MTTHQLQHDPRTKQQIKDALYTYLYAPVERKLKRTLDELIVANSRALASSHDSFIYRNKVYKREETSKVPRRKNPLVPALHERMDAYLAQVEQLNTQEIPYVVGFINQVLNSSDDMQDYLRVFPEPLHPPLHEMIDKCPCHTTKLKTETVEELVARNQEPIELIKHRLVHNLLLQ